MKKIIYTLTFLMGLFLAANTTSSYAQDSKMQIGIGALYGTGPGGSSTLQPDFGINADGYYSVSDNIRVDVGLGYYLPKKQNGLEVTQFVVNFNGHYLFTEEGSFKPYGLAGLNYMTQKVGGGNFSASGSKVGLNLGGGANIGAAFAEAKYVIGSFSQFVVNAGVRFGL